jgi:hypothetical protein
VVHFALVLVLEPVKAAAAAAAAGSVAAAGTVVAAAAVVAAVAAVVRNGLHIAERTVVLLRTRLEYAGDVADMPAAVAVAEQLSGHFPQVLVVVAVAAVQVLEAVVEQLAVNASSLQHQPLLLESNTRLTNTNDSLLTSQNT